MKKIMALMLAMVFLLSACGKDEQTYREDYAQELSLLRKGISLRNVQKITGTSLGTLQKIKQYI